MQYADLVHESLRIMRSEINERQVEVSIISESELPPVMVDPQQMKQAFFNIIKNAVQAMTAHDHLEIRLSADDRDMTISFKDTGTGIDEDIFNRLFEPFSTSKPDGNGLGLMIVQRIIQAHGGRLDVSTKRDAGTCFRIVLPLADRKARMLTHNKSKESTTEE